MDKYSSDFVIQISCQKSRQKKGSKITERFSQLTIYWKIPMYMILHESMTKEYKNSFSWKISPNGYKKTNKSLKIRIYSFQTSALAWTELVVPCATVRSIILTTYVCSIILVSSRQNTECYSIS